MIFAPSRPETAPCTEKSGGPSFERSRADVPCSSNETTSAHENDTTDNPTATPSERSVIEAPLGCSLRTSATHFDDRSAFDVLDNDDDPSSLSRVARSMLASVVFLSSSGRGHAQT